MLITKKPTAGLKLNPLLDALVPQMREKEEWPAFLEDIRHHGILEPLVVGPDGVTVLDGRHRLRAAKELGLTTVRVRQADLCGQTETEYAVNAAVLRRHLTDEQRSMLAADLRQVLSDQARGARAAKAGRSGGRGRPRAEVPGEGDSLSPPGGGKLSDTRQQAADTLGVSRKKVEKAEQLKKVAPELANEVRAGKKKLSVARREAGLSRAASRAPQSPIPTATLTGKANYTLAAGLASRLSGFDWISVEFAALLEVPKGGGLLSVWRSVAEGDGLARVLVASVADDRDADGQVAAGSDLGSFLAALTGRPGHAADISACTGRPYGIRVRPFHTDLEIEVVSPLGAGLEPDATPSYRAEDACGPLDVPIPLADGGVTYPPGHQFAGIVFMPPPRSSVAPQGNSGSADIVPRNIWDDAEDGVREDAEPKADGDVAG